MKRPVLILGGVAVLVLVAAAFIGGKLIQQRSSDADLAQPLMQVTSAAKVPKGDPVVDGYMDYRDDNSVFLCAFVSGPTINQDETINKGGACGGMVEVVITHETKFLHDISAEPKPMPTEGLRPEDWIVQQVVEPGDLSALTNRSGLQVWGQRNGNRVVSDTIVYWTARPAP